MRSGDFVSSESDGLDSSVDDVINSCQFSFLEYDFRMCFIANNGCVVEEECYLEIMNVSEANVTVKCLFKKNANFNVEPNIIHNLNAGAITL